MSPSRQSELESLLRRLRQRAFDSVKAEALIPKVKARLMPLWDERAAEHERRRQDAYMHLMT